MTETKKKWGMTDDVVMCVWTKHENKQHQVEPLIRNLSADDFVHLLHTDLGHKSSAMNVSRVALLTNYWGEK